MNQLRTALSRTAYSTRLYAPFSFSALSTRCFSTPQAAETVARKRTRKAVLTLTPTAVNRLKAILEERQDLLKISIKKKGCSGQAYSLEYVKQPSKFDELVEQDGVKVLVDSKALFSLIGSEMDYVEDKLSSQFVFHNPNVKEMCGCGQSFMT